jgi:hypothetical protein
VAFLVRRAAVPAGCHTVFWNGKDDGGHTVASGIYFYQLRAGSSSLTRRLVLIK